MVVPVEVLEDGLHEQVSIDGRWGIIHIMYLQYLWFIWCLMDWSSFMIVFRFDCMVWLV